MDIGYVAGFLDGEGYIGINRTTLQVKITQCRKEVLEQLKETFGGSISNHAWNMTRGPNNRMAWEWSCTNQKAHDLLVACLPYLIVKKKEAEFGVSFWEAEDRLQKRDDYREELKALRKAA